MQDFLTFRRMITPIIIQVIFWVSTIVIVILGLISLAIGNTAEARIGGLIMLLVGPLVVRVYCEILIVIFRINDTLTDIRSDLGRQQGGQ